jgi:hypothetical protein
VSDDKTEWNLILQSEGKRLLGKPRPRPRCEDNIEINPKEVMCEILNVS